MSIRQKIFLPVLGIVLVALGLLGFVSWQAHSGREQMRTVAERALEAEKLSLQIVQEFESAQVVIKNVMAMTSFIESSQIEQDFSKTTNELAEDIDRLAHVALNDAMSEAIETLASVYKDWKADVSITLGLVPSQKVPTLEKIDKHRRTMIAAIGEITELTKSASVSELNSVSDAAEQSMFWSIAIALFSGMGGLVFALWLANTLSRPIVRLTDSMRELAAGNLEIELDADTRIDEIGEMTQAIAVFRQNAIERMRLAGESEAEQHTRNERQTRIDSLIEGFRTSATTSMSLVSDHMQSMQNTARNLGQASESTLQEAADISRVSDQASGNVNSVAQASEELSLSVKEISTQVQQATEMAEMADTATRESSEKISDLAQSSDTIGEVIELISAIAAQTNLLALNATIEAARAGEAGRGFAVVASEVKELASQTAKATEDISSQIGGIQHSTSAAVKSIESITTAMAKVREFTSVIAAAIEQQSMSTETINQNVREASEGSAQVTSGIGTMNEAAKSALSATKTVEDTSREVAEQAAELNQSIDQFLREVSAA